MEIRCRPNTTQRPVTNQALGHTLPSAAEARSVLVRLPRHRSGAQIGTTGSRMPPTDGAMMFRGSPDLAHAPRQVLDDVDQKNPLPRIAEQGEGLVKSHGLGRAEQFEDGNLPRCRCAAAIRGGR